MSGQGTRKGTENLTWFLGQSLEVQRDILADYPQLVHLLILHIMEREVESYTGGKHERNSPHGRRYSRWGTNRGSIAIGRHHIPIDVPRVRDNQTKQTVPLKSYESLRKIEPGLSEATSLFYGISTRNYPKATGKESGFGLSKSSLSREIVEQSREIHREFFERDLSQSRFAGLFIDGTHLGTQTMVIVLGIDEFGQKRALSFAQTHTENKESVSELLRELIARGLEYKHGLLCIIDGSKGLRAAVDEVFGPYALVQRCQWHKIENVLGYLAKRDQSEWKRKLRYAFGASNYTEAKTLIRELEIELQQTNPSAAKSLVEGQEDYLCLQRLGLAELFKDSFSSTNCIEALNSQIKGRLRNVKNWESADQRHRWLAWALLEIEGRLQKVKNSKNLSLLIEIVSEYIKKSIKKGKAGR